MNRNVDNASRVACNVRLAKVIALHVRAIDSSETNSALIATMIILSFWTRIQSARHAIHRARHASVLRVINAIRALKVSIWNWIRPANRVRFRSARFARITESARNVRMAKNSSTECVCSATSVLPNISTASIASLAILHARHALVLQPMNARYVRIIMTTINSPSRLRAWVVQMH